MANTTAKHMADMVMAKRAEEFRRREKVLRDIVADYFDATEQAQKTRATAQTRADKIRAQVDERIAALRDQAANTADEHERRAIFAISQMLALGENPKAIADTLSGSLR